MIGSVEESELLSVGAAFVPPLATPILVHSMVLATP